MRSVLVASLLVILAGCATSHVMVGNARPAISPGQVKIYLHPPEKYEEIAILDTSSQGSFSFTQQGKMDSVVERLKAEAAKLGANGILLEVLATGTAVRSARERAPLRHPAIAHGASARDSPQRRSKR